MTPSIRTKDFIVLAAIAATLAYGSLFSFSGWHAPSDSLWSQFVALPYGIGFSDIFIAILVYLPLGAVLTRLVSATTSTSTKILIAIVYGALFSLSLELTQGYIPSRLASIYHVALNVVGIAIGAMIAVPPALTSSLTGYIRDLKMRHANPGALATLGLVVTGLWLCAQLVPFVPSFDINNVVQGLEPIALLLQREVSYSLLATSSYASGTLAVAVILRESLILRSGRSRKIALLVIGVLVLKIFFVGPQLSIEELIGTCVGLGIFRIARYKIHDSLPILAMAAIGMLVMGNGMRVNSTAFVQEAIQGPPTNDIIGIADLISGIWPYCGLAFLALLAFRHRGGGPTYLPHRLLGDRRVCTRHRMEPTPPTRVARPPF